MVPRGTISFQISQCPRKREALGKEKKKKKKKGKETTFKDRTVYLEHLEAFASCCDALLPLRPLIFPTFPDQLGLSEQAQSAGPGAPGRVALKMCCSPGVLSPGPKSTRWENCKLKGSGNLAFCLNQFHGSNSFIS